MLSNAATPKYYGEFRNKVICGEIPVNKQISLEMNRIDRLIKNPKIYYDDQATDKWINFCETEMTLTDGSPVHMLDSFKLWGEQVFGWYFFTRRQVWDPNGLGNGRGCYVKHIIKKRLTTKQYLIVGRGAAKTMYDTFIHSYFLNCDPSTTDQITTAPTMKQADEVIMPFITAINRSPGPMFKFLTFGSQTNTTGSRTRRQKLFSSKKGIQNTLTNSILQVKPMSVDKLQGSRAKIATVDEWLSCDIREDPITAIAQSASKHDSWLIVATSSEGTVRNGPGDDVKMELMSILREEYNDPRTSIWWYKLDDVSEVGNPDMWKKANPNLGITVTYEVYQDEVRRAQHNPIARNDILAKRFGIPMEGYTYFFTYAETKCHPTREYWQLPCALGCDLSQGGDFCSFVFLFPLSKETFGVKTLNFISEYTLHQLQPAMREKYNEFITEGSLIVMNGTILDMNDVYDSLDQHIEEHQYDIRSVGYDPYNAKEFINRWCIENGSWAVEKVIQGAKTESVPLTEIKKLAEDRRLIFDEALYSFTMGNCVVIEDTNGNKKLFKLKNDAKIDAVAATMDAFVSYKLHKESFE